MSAPKWQAGQLYLPGDLVQPITAPTPAPAVIVNADFEAGNTGWTLGTGWTITSSGSKFAGAWSAEFQSGTGNVISQIEATAYEPVKPGTRITASAKFNQGASSSGNLAGVVILKWYTSANVLISESKGNVIISGSNGEWKVSIVTATAPATAAKVRAAFECDRSGDNFSAWVDNFAWNLIAASLPGGLIYKAVQAAAGTSGASEPAWPNVLGQQVIDNQVTWEAVNTSRVTWTASPILVSGAVQPTWPTTPGTVISDGTIAWECVTREIEDENCPRSKVVAIVSGKVFAADKDIVRFSATANPLDWSSEQDAGYLPTGLQQANANDMAVLNQYRSNLVAFNASSFQNWQVDPDPASMAILDQMDGIGSTWQRAAVPVSNDLFYLSQLGVRTVGIAAGAENLSAGDVGMPIDPLVRDALRVAIANSTKALATYYPGAGQYWLAFSDYPAAALTLSGDVPGGYAGTVINTSYSTSGGLQPYGVYSVASGTFPPGLSLNVSSGAVTGSYTATGSYSWVIARTDAAGTTATLADSSTVAEGHWSGTDRTDTADHDTVLSNLNKDAEGENSNTTTGFEVGVRGALGRSAGKWYFEISVERSLTNMHMGLRKSTDGLTAAFSGATGAAMNNGNGMSVGITSGTHGNSVVTGSVIGVQVDLDNRRVWFKLNGAYLNNGGGTEYNPTNYPNGLFDVTLDAGTYHPWTKLQTPANSTTANNGKVRLRVFSSEFTGAIPSGYSAWGGL